MANLIEYIQSQVYENSTEDISGSIMQQVLTRMASDEGVVNVHTISGQTPFADYNNAQAARDAVPAGFKKLGLIITYKLSSGWYVDEFIGSATSGWSTASNWKCLGPISVSQNASTGKTTITIGSQSYDVATQPVSVSQNTLSIGGEDKGELAGQLIENPEWVKVVTDSEGRILYGIKTDGKLYFGAGCPPQVIEYVTNILGTFTASNYADVMNFLGNLIDGDNLSTLLNIKADKEEGKSLIDSEFANAQSVIENPVFLRVVTDSMKRIIEAITKNGEKEIYLPTIIKDNFKVVGEFESNGFKYSLIQAPDWFLVVTDSQKRIVFGIRNNGKSVFPAGIEGFEFPNKSTLDKFSEEDGVLLWEGEPINNESGDILSLYTDIDTKPILSQYSHYTNGTWTHQNWSDPANLTFLWFSDLHSVWRRLGRIMKFYQHYSEYFDDIITTGDQNHAFNYDYSYWALEHANKAIPVIGNHDCFGPARTFTNELGETVTIEAYAEPGYGQKECYEKYFEPFLDDTHIIIEEDKCYFYKDYSIKYKIGREEVPSEEYKIRLIGLDDFHCNETIRCEGDGHTTIYPDGTSVDTGQQLSWLENILEDARQNNMYVICITHMPIAYTPIKCPFQTIMPVAAGYQQGVAFRGKVQDFINNGGKFVTWLVGETHQDGFGYITNYPDQLQIMMGTSGSRTEDAGEFERIENTRSDDLFHIISFNFKYSTLSIHRIGCNYDKFGRHIGNITFDFLNKQIIQFN